MGCRAAEKLAEFRGVFLRRSAQAPNGAPDLVAPDGPVMLAHFLCDIQPFWNSTPKYIFYRYARFVQAVRERP